jgi:hypothetical protein
MRRGARLDAAGVLNEHDGPTLVHGIYALHGTKVSVPRNAELRPCRRLGALSFRR